MERNMLPDLEKCIEFHGHFCPGLAIGYRGVKAALSYLGQERAKDEELVALVESDGCGIDAVQVLLGCTIGKGNLIYRDYGKQAYTIVCRQNGKGVRVALKADSLPPNLEREEKINQVLSLSEQILFKIEPVEVHLPSKAKIFSSVTCAYCKEKVMEPRARLRDGKVACQIGRAHV